jgi:hypothetical protein
MGWFGKKKTEIDSDYVDVEDMPIAVAVMDSSTVAPSAPPASQERISNTTAYVAPSAPPASQERISNTTAYAAIPQYHQHQQVVVTHEQQQQPVPHVFLTRIPTMLNPCPFCSQSARTRVRTAPNWATWLTAIILFVLFWPISWIPLVSDSMKQTDHFCTSCQRKVGTVGPFKDCCVKHRF